MEGDIVLGSVRRSQSGPEFQEGPEATGVPRRARVGHRRLEFQRGPEGAGRGQRE